MKAYVDYRELLANPEEDAVVIATPDHWHCQMVLDAAQAGKHIYCEKGFSRTLAEAKLMRDALKRSNVVFQLGHHARQATCALQANARLPELAARSRARFVDVAGALTAPDGSLDRRFTSDGIHLNGPGYLRWTDAIRRYVGSGCQR